MIIEAQAVAAYTLSDISRGVPPPPLGADVRIEVGHCRDYIPDDLARRIMFFATGAHRVQITGSGLGYHDLLRQLQDRAARGEL